MTHDCDLLREDMLAFARAMLDRFGGFQPFGGYVLAPGQRVQVGFAPGLLAPPLSERIETLATELGEIDRAAVAHALVFDVPLHVPLDGMDTAIRLHLSQVDGRCLDLFVPYRARTGLPTLFGTSFVVEGTPIGFPRQ